MKVKNLARHSLYAIMAGAMFSILTPAAMATEKTDIIKAANSQVPGYFRMALGDDITVTAFYDGPVYLKPSILKGTNGRYIDSMLKVMSVPINKDGVQTSVNAYLIQQNDRLTLIDSGAAKCFGDTLGNLVSNIKLSGINPDDVDSIIVTHMHPDHACGATNPDGTAAFPNAEFVAPKKDADYWLSESIAKTVPDSERSFFDAARRTVAPYKASGRFRTFESGESPVPGIESIDEAGHSPGMSGYLIGNKDHKLLVWGDIIHSHAVQFKHPEVAVIFDYDPKAAVATRHRILNDAVHGNLWIAAAHLPFPGIGHVVTDGEGYRWVPVEYGPVR
ncbi:MBL fold metallo-hydrolase [Xenorhabdus anantnagensis]|uniref:MBL fold metallo-hydrolase n=1 Tax=Xenorhabdus anantnagensis TaxID=3025875 RepID=A0ABT5LVI4_9GAMM|nr:MBL fold metallo-hydrolase [Xenorhabdus anantnagensis]MDC9598229.1 MBL fold metallo-hydrolase [Xenorhabdus anantnagensis]